MFITKHKLEMTESALRVEIISLKGKLEQLNMDYKRNTKQLLQLEESNKRLRVEIIRLKGKLEESNKRLLDYFNVREENIPAKTVLRVKGGPE